MEAPEARASPVRRACLGLAAWMARPERSGASMRARPPVTDDRATRGSAGRDGHARGPGPSGRPSPPEEVTRLLRRWGDGDESALDRLIPLVYDELHRVAHRRLSGEATGHTLQTTELVHEAYARLAEADLRWSDRVHFFALAARTMRRILVDWARARAADKRGGGAEIVTLRTVVLDRAGADEDPIDVLALHDALERLEEQDARKAKVVEVHVFGGLTHVETAQALGISTATVERELRLAKAWLARELA